MRGYIMKSVKIILPIVLATFIASPACSMQSQSWFQKIKNSGLTLFLFGGPVLAPTLGAYAGFKAGIKVPTTFGKKFLTGAATATGVTWASFFLWSKAAPRILLAQDANGHYK